MANCTPWYYPMDATFDNDDQKLILCDASAAIVFEEYFSEANCSQCKADCDWTEYSAELVATTLNTDTLCSYVGSNGNQFNPLDDIQSHLEETQGTIFSLFSEMMENKGRSINIETPSFNDTEVFKEYLLGHCIENLANEDLIISFTISSPYITVVEKTEKVSFSDRLGIIGGTIGLFTGMSLISVVEAFYWITKGFLGHLMSTGCRSPAVKNRQNK